MEAARFFDLELGDGLTWAVIAVGIVTAASVFVLGVAWLYERARLAYDRRQAGRRAGNPVQVAIARDADPSANLFNGVVVDRSLGGISLAVPAEISVGTFLRVRPADAPRDVPWARVEVLHCARFEDRWRLGCVFASLPPWNILKRFG